MLRIILKQLFLVFCICLANKQAVAITGEEISAKVSDWLIKEGINGKPIFSKNSSFNDCKTQIEIARIFKNYKTIKVKCLDKNGFELIMRVKTFEEVKVKKKLKPKVKKSKAVSQNTPKNKKNETYKIIKLKRSLEKNDIIQSNDIQLLTVKNKHQASFFSNKKELVGRKLKKNLKMGQILHPRHLFESYDISNGDSILIVSNSGNASVTVAGEAQDSGNLGDLIRVKNLRSGKIVKGYIKKDKKIKIFR